MIITKAVNRIFWRFGGNDNKNPFPVNDLDVEAYNAIKDYVQETQKQQYEQSELFAKLYIYLFQKILENDNATVMDKEPRRKIYNLLKKPLQSIISDFTQSLNDSERYEVLESAGVSMEHPALETEENRKNDTAAIQEALKEPENMQKFLGEVWDFETVSEIVQTEVNQAINLFK